MTGRIRCNEANLPGDSRTTGLASDSPPADADILFLKRHFYDRYSNHAKEKIKWIKKHIGRRPPM